MYNNTANPDRLTNFNGKSISYNALGYPTYYDSKTWKWENGKLVRIHKGSANQPGAKYEDCTFTYDGYGRRTRKHYIYDPNPAVAGDGNYYYTTNYTYDESGRLIREHITEYRDTGTTTTREFIYLYDESGIIGTMYGTNGSAPQAYYYRRNLQGDVVAIYDQYGSRKVEYAYDAFGNCTILYTGNAGLAESNPIRYRGYYYDREINLYYLNARYYNPQWRRFISPDDTGYLDPETPNGLNLYAYCNNDPVNYADPSGHMAFWLAAGLFVAGLGLIAGGAYAGISSYESGDRGWNLVGDIALGGLIGGIAGFAIGASLGAGASGLLTGSFVSSVRLVKAGAIMTYQMAKVGGTIAAWYMMADNWANSLHHTTHIFWSGGDLSKNGGKYLSSYVNGITLDMTKLGQYLEKRNVPYEAWIIASQNFANQVPYGGTVFSFQNMAIVNPTSIWALYEYPILNSNCINVIYVNLGGL